MAVERIYVVGFMGAGKSTIAREVALKLGWTILDLDSEIEESEQTTVRDIFEHFGEAHFRKLERQHLQRVCRVPQAVIALGGGAYIDPENRRIVETTGVAVWLQASISTITERLRPDGTRPLFSTPGKMRDLYDSRLPSYKLAPIHVLTDNRLPGEIADEIIREVAKL